jgi:hypothetical protein
MYFGTSGFQNSYARPDVCVAQRGIFPANADKKVIGEVFMSQLNDVIEQSVRAQDVPFLVAMVGDKDGIK